MAAEVCRETFSKIDKRWIRKRCKNVYPASKSGTERGGEKEREREKEREIYIV